MTCPCGEAFETTTAKKAAKHCSRACASKYSMTAVRRKAQRKAGLAHTENLLTQAEVLRKRERWKYAALAAVLRGRSHQFEYELEGYVFDLALTSDKILVEFDGPYHLGPRQLVRDRKKEKIAKKHGFRLVRRTVLPASVIGAETIRGL